MGFYDREYYRDEYAPSQGSGLTLRAPRTINAWLIIACVAFYFIDDLFFGRRLSVWCAVTPETLSHPLFWWQFLTYGFVHGSFSHLFGNMLELFFLGRYVEQAYGGKEYLRVYLTMLAFGSVVWAIGTGFAPVDPDSLPPALIGASGAISGVVILFVLNFPNAQLMLFPIPIPVRAWVIGVICVLYNFWGIMEAGDNVAYGVHIAGMVFAAVYFRFRWNLGDLASLIPGKNSFFSRPKLKIHFPNDEQQIVDMQTEVDRILEKISQSGEQSLTRKERQILERASREFQKRREGKK